MLHDLVRLSAAGELEPTEVQEVEAGRGGWRIGPADRWFRPVAYFIRAAKRSSVYPDYDNDYDYVASVVRCRQEIDLLVFGDAAPFGRG